MDSLLSPTWVLDASTSAATDNCTTVLGGYLGYPLGFIWGSLLYEVSIGDYNSVFWDNYLPSDYANVYVGGVALDGLAAFGGQYYAYDFIVQGFPEDGVGGYAPLAPLPPDQVLLPGGGVTPGFYDGYTLFYPL